MLFWTYWLLAALLLALIARELWRASEWRMQLAAALVLLPLLLRVLLFK
ncbi:MAG: hypothetical protein IPG71_05810 [bacterium]|nr:hypothetical protein [bacterium]